MINQITESFANCKNGNCTCNIKSFHELISDSEIYIFDEDIPGKELPARLVEKDEYFQVKVVNADKEDIVFIKIDQCLLIDNGIRKCDCAILDANNFFFIEIKDVKTKQRKSARKEAIEQLASTIELFLDKLDFTDYNLFAIIGFRTAKPYIIQPSRNTQRAIFKAEYNVTLQEGSQIVV